MSDGFFTNRDHSIVNYNGNPADHVADDRQIEAFEQYPFGDLSS